MPNNQVEGLPEGVTLDPSLVGTAPAQPAQSAPEQPVQGLPPGVKLDPSLVGTAPSSAPAAAASAVPETSTWQRIKNRLFEPVTEEEVEKVPGLEPKRVEELQERGLDTLDSWFGKQNGEYIRDKILNGYTPEVVARAGLKTLTDWYSPAMLAMSVPGRIAHGYAAGAEAAAKIGDLQKAAELTSKAKLAGVIGTLTGVPMVGHQVYDLVDNWNRMTPVERGAALAGILGGATLTGVGVHEAGGPKAVAKALAEPVAGAAAAAVAPVKEAAGRVVEKVKTAGQEPLPKTKEGLAARATQATGEDVTAAANALSKVDTRGVKSFDDLADVLDKKVKENTAEVDKRLAEHKDQYNPYQLDREVPVEGGEPIITNPVMEALDQLEKFYDKTGSPEDVARIRGVQNKYLDQGLTPKEINDIAREHGGTLTGFNANGELSTGLTKQNAENTRAGVKDVVHDLTGGVAKPVDKETSDLITARGLVQDMAEKVEKLENKLQAPSPLRKAAEWVTTPVREVAKAVFKEVLGLGKGAGDRQLSPVDLEKQLPRILQRLDELNKMTPQQAAQSLRLPGGLPAQEGESVNPTIAAPERAAAFKEPHIDFEDLPRGMDTKSVLNHELGHSVVAKAMGFNPIDVISNQHSENLGKTNIATTRMDWGKDLQQRPDGTVPTEKIKDKLDNVMTTIMAGAAANELYDGIPYEENPALAGDHKMARGILKDLGYSPEEADAKLREYVDKAKEILQQPHVQDIINAASDTREPNLPDTHHYSAGRIQQILRQIEEAGNEGNQTRNAPSAEQQRQANVTGGEKVRAAGIGLQAAGKATAEPIKPEITGLREKSTGNAEADKAIKAAGAIPGGEMMGLGLFHDPKTGSTLAIPLDEATPEQVTKQLRESRAKFGVKEEEPTGQATEKSLLGLGLAATKAESPEDFKNWFGESKIVDKSGKPLTVYHGTMVPGNIEEFEIGPPVDEEGNERITGSGDPNAYLGPHFAIGKGSEKIANAFATGTGADYLKQRREMLGGEAAPKVYPVYLKIDNPRDFGSEHNLNQFIYEGKIHDDQLVDEAMRADKLDPEDYDSPEVKQWLNRYDTDPVFRADQNRWLMEQTPSSLGYEDDSFVLKDAARSLADNAKDRLLKAGFDGVLYKNELEGGNAVVPIKDPVSQVRFAPENKESVEKAYGSKKGQ